MMIREIREEEVPECVRVIRESFQTVADEFGFTRENAPRFTAFSATEEKLRQQMQEQKKPMYAAFSEEGCIIGCYSLSSRDWRSCELNNLCVRPDWRHRKVGQTLLQDACGRAKALGYEKITLGIVEENTRLRNWYEAHGFIHTGTWKFDFFPFTCGYMERKL